MGNRVAVFRRSKGSAADTACFSRQIRTRNSAGRGSLLPSRVIQLRRRAGYASSTVASPPLNAWSRRPP